MMELLKQLRYSVACQDLFFTTVRVGMSNSFNLCRLGIPVQGIQVITSSSLIDHNE